MNGIGFKNMKVFKEHQWFDFKPITLLTGTNNSGKSSVINAMQMLQENLSAKTLDELLETEFVLTANQNKYGSIDTFINKQSDDNTFQFERIIDEFKYIIHIKILDGLQKKGVISSVDIFCIEANERIFEIKVDDSCPDLKCSFNVNYLYFLDKFNKKCENTLLYYEKMEALKMKVKKLNEGNIDLKNEIEKEITLIENEYKLEIFFTNEVDTFSINDDGTIEDNNNNREYEIHQITFKDCNNDFFQLHDSDLHNQVLFTYREEVGKKNEFGIVFRKSGNGVLHQDIFNEMFLTPYKNGILNIPQILNEEEDNFVNLNFQSKIANYYSESFDTAYKIFCNDLVSFCSNYVWHPNFESVDEDFDPKTSLVYKYINGLIDFGTITSIIQYTNKNDDDNKFHHFPSAPSIIRAKKELINTQRQNKLDEKGFIDFFKNQIAPLLFDSFKDDDNNFNKRKKVIDENVYKVINRDINQILLDFNICFENVYVSSNRFVSKRSYSFNDNSDFTNLLKGIENLNGHDDKNIIYEFINNWLKEFDIADELVFKSDSDTGNFKAFLKKNDLIIPLADYGLGTNQLLPILFSLSLAKFTSSNTVVIEEPEANLHPAMQSKLADMFVDANKKFKVQIIAETHSEYLIRKLQYLVGSNKSELKPKDVVIYYFYKQDHVAVVSQEVNQVEKIEIDQLGRLTKEFGTGFFDEADRIAIDIFLLNQSQSN